MVKDSSANAGDIRDVGLIPGSGRSPGEGHDKPLQCSWLENPMDRGAWQAMIHRVAKSRTQLKRLSMHANLKLPIVTSCLYTGYKSHPSQSLGLSHVGA